MKNIKLVHILGSIFLITIVIAMLHPQRVFYKRDKVKKEPSTFEEFTIDERLNKLEEHVLTITFLIGTSTQEVTIIQLFQMLENKLADIVVATNEILIKHAERIKELENNPIITE